MGLPLCGVQKCCGSNLFCPDLPESVTISMTNNLGFSGTAMVWQRLSWGISGSNATCIGQSGPGFVPVGAVNFNEYFSNNVLGSGAFAIGCNWTVGAWYNFGSACLPAFGGPGVSSGRSFNRSRIVLRERSTSPYYLDFDVELSDNNGTTWYFAKSVIVSE